jgi:hypothetical protein
MLRPLALNARRTAVSMSTNRLQAVARHLSGMAPVDEAVGVHFIKFAKV